MTCDTTIRKAWIGVSCLCIYCYNQVHVTQASMTNESSTE